MADPRAKKEEAKAEVNAAPAPEEQEVPEVLTWLASMVTTIATPVFRLGVGILSAAVGVVVLFGSEAGAALGRQILELMTMLGLLSSEAIDAISVRWPGVRRFLGRVIWWSVFFVLLFVALGLGAALIGWREIAIAFAIAAVVVPYVAAMVIQVAIGRIYAVLLQNPTDKARARMLGLDVSRPFAAFSIITLFVGLMILMLPTPLRHVQVAAALAGMLVLGSSYLLLLGEKSNRAYRLMYLAGITLSSTMLVWTYLVPSEVQNLVFASTKAVESMAAELSDQAGSLNLKERMATQNLVLLGQAEDQYSVAADTKLWVNYGDKYQPMDGSVPVSPAYAVYDVSSGHLKKLGYAESILLKALPKPVKPEHVAATQPVPTAPATATVPATSSPTTSVASIDEATIEASVGEWEEIPPSPIVPQAGDMVVLGPLNDPKEFARIESIVGLNTEEAVIAKVFDDPAGGFIAKRGVTRSHHEPMRFRVLDGDPVTVNVRIERGEFARYQAQTRKEAS